ncbi:mevalonate kinase [Paramicrobacterium agarici]|uniref:mevalonate kinase n=1 Tax=Paramicrobacterium agarici TaxID=630514 RepID=A0A2A9DZ24_9MICO|nr:mevalonate kinase [Microbacterium agarici]PFG31571.1 mevalonate kinase [Microbacterium agarici]
MQQPERWAEGSAHAKTILLGEHAVVYGRPAIAFPVTSLTLVAHARSTDGGLSLDTPYHHGAVAGDDSLSSPREERLAEAALRHTLDHLGRQHHGVDVTVTGRIPAARGLGSSAAVASAIASAVARLEGVWLSYEERFELVQFVERIAHGTPSGLDAHATMAEGPIIFERGTARPLPHKGVPPLVVADTGVAGHTAAAVAGVRARRERDASGVDARLDAIAALVEGALDELRSRDYVGLGERMNACHSILSELGVSSPELDALVSAARNAGALGAKLTGGGQGGCIIALAPRATDVPELVAALSAAGATGAWPVTDKEAA